jgi:hypothetical protein
VLARQGQVLAVGIGLLTATGVALAEPSVTQVTQAIQSGRLDQAQNMIQEVLAKHPNSAEAYYLESRVLARQGQWTAAGQALHRAETLSPGMPFVAPKALAQYRAELKKHGALVASTATLPVATRQGGGAGRALVYFLGLVFIIAAIAWFMRRRRQQQILMARNNGATGFGNPYGPNYGPGMGPNPGGMPGGAPMAGPGMGSGLASGLATGLGIGAGVAAGSALANGLFHHGDGGNASAPAGDNGDLGLLNNDWGDQNQVASNDDFGLGDGGDGGDWG